MVSIYIIRPPLSAIKPKYVSSEMKFAYFKRANTYEVNTIDATVLTVKCVKVENKKYYRFCLLLIHISISTFVCRYTSDYYYSSMEIIQFVTAQPEIP